MTRKLAALVAATFAGCATAAPTSVLFVGNSFTFGRANPVMQYATGTVTDMNLQNWLANMSGSNEDEPHPWGGIPAIFKAFTVEAGLDYDVKLSARNAATLRGHYLNTNGVWDLRVNMAAQKWDVVVLQEQSDEPLSIPDGNPARFTIFADKIEKWIHTGAAEAFRESQLYPGGANTLRNIPANPNANPNARIYLYQTWSRPDLTYVAGEAYFGQPIEAMNSELHAAYYGLAASNPNFTDVSPVGDAFMRAVNEGVAMRNPYEPTAGLIDLWWDDHFHPSRYGSYLSALVHFHTITGVNPLSLGASEHAAADLGIAPEIAVQLQRVAQATVDPDMTAPSSTAAATPAANAAGWNNGPVTIAFNAADEAKGSGVAAVRYQVTGAGARSGELAPGESRTLAADGTSTMSWSAVDRAGNVEAPHALTVSIDATAPTIAGLPVDCSIWPPNHRMVDVATVSGAESLSGLASLAVVATSSEGGAGDVAVAGSGLEPRRVSLRADRAGTGTGRVYTVTATAADLAGNVASASATCTVPLSLGTGG
jgi:hypothetical protein